MANHGLDTRQANVTTYELYGKFLSHARESPETHLAVNYSNNREPVDEPQVSVVPKTAYDLVSGLPWFKTWDPLIHWAARQAPITMYNVSRNPPEVGLIYSDVIIGHGFQRLRPKRGLRRILTLVKRMPSVG